MSDPQPDLTAGWRDPAGPHAPFPPAGWAQPQTSTSAIVAMILAVLSFVFPLVPAIVAILLARSAQEEIAASGGRVTGGGIANAARVTAWANVYLSIAVLVAGLAVVLLFPTVI